MTTDTAPRVRLTVPIIRNHEVVMLAFMLGTLLWRLSLFIERMIWAVRYPSELDYGEGIVWEQMNKIVSGHGYGPINGFPAIVFHYPPMYHLLTWMLSSATGTNALAAGRALSAFSGIAAATVAGLITAQLVENSSRSVRCLCGATAGLVALSCLPIVLWAPMMRVDMVASALTLAGLYLAMHAVKRPQFIYSAAIAFVAAVYTKQTMIAAPAAVFLTLLWLRPQSAIRGIITCLALGFLMLGTLGVETEGGFWRHIFLYNVNRFEPSRFILIPSQIGVHFLFVIIAVFGLVSTVTSLINIFVKTRRVSEVGERLPADATIVRSIIAGSYFFFSSVMLILVGKIGSNINYFVDWFFALSIFSGVALRQAVGATNKIGTVRNIPYYKLVLSVVIPVFIAGQAILLPVPTKWGPIDRPGHQAELQRLVTRIRAAERPVISDDMVSILQAGKNVVWEPAIFAELSATGLYDERPIVRMIRNKDFAFFVTEGDRGSRLFNQRYSPAVAQAMADAYPRRQNLAGYVLHLPAD